VTYCIKATAAHSCQKKKVPIRSAVFQLDAEALGIDHSLKL
jgi:hypothetical protein